MTDNETMKSADNETVKQRIKAIYPHITVSGTVDKPFYNIDWYDIEKQTMYRGWSSYNLELVRKWLEEEFEAVEADIDDLINRQKTEIEQYKAIICTDTEYIERIKVENRKQQAEIERLEDLNKCYYTSCQQTAKSNHEIKAEAVKEFAERLKEHREIVGYDRNLELNIYGSNIRIDIDEFDDFVKEMVGADNG